MSEGGDGCIERPSVSSGDGSREGGLGLAWRPTGPDTYPHIYLLQPTLGVGACARCF